MLLTQDKKSLRKQILSRRSELGPEELKYAGEDALDKLIALESFDRAKTVMLYMDFRKEVPTGNLIDHVVSSGKTLVLPLTDKNFEIIPYKIDFSKVPFKDLLKTSSFGVSEPNPEYCAVIDPQEIDLVIVPGSVFDESNNRIGYGKGCYDRFLPLLRAGVSKIALAYDFQVLKSIPSDPSDVKMDGILKVSTHK